MTPFLVVVALAAIALVVRTVLSIRRDTRSSRADGDHVSEVWRDEHYRERRDDT